MEPCLGLGKCRNETKVSRYRIFCLEVKTEKDENGRLGRSEKGVESNVVLEVEDMCLA